MTTSQTIKTCTGLTSYTSTVFVQYIYFMKIRLQAVKDAGQPFTALLDTDQNADTTSVNTKTNKQKKTFDGIEQTTSHAAYNDAQYVW